MIFSSSRILLLIALAFSTLIPLIAQDSEPTKAAPAGESQEEPSQGNSGLIKLPDTFVKTFKNPFMRSGGSEPKKQEQVNQPQRRPFWGNLRNIFKSDKNKSPKPAVTKTVEKEKSNDGSVIPPNKTEENITSEVESPKSKPFWGNLKNIFKSKKSENQTSETEGVLAKEDNNEASVIPPKVSENNSDDLGSSSKETKPFWGNLKNIFKSEKAEKTQPAPEKEVIADQNKTDDSVIPAKNSEKVAKKEAKSSPFWGNLKNIFKAEKSKKTDPSSQDVIADQQGRDGSVIPAKSFKKISSPKQGSPKPIISSKEKSSEKASPKRTRKVEPSTSEENNVVAATSEKSDSRKDNRTWKNKYTPSKPPQTGTEGKIKTREQVLAEMRNEVGDMKSSNPNKSIVGRLFGSEEKSNKKPSDVPVKKADSPQVAQNQSNSQSTAPKGNFFSRLFGSKKDKSPALAQHDPVVKPENQSIKKETIPAAETTAKPARGNFFSRLFGSKKNKSLVASKEDQLAKSSPSESIATAPTSKADSAHNLSLLDRLFGPRKKRPSKSSKSQSESHIATNSEKPAEKPSSTIPHPDKGVSKTQPEQVAGTKQPNKPTDASTSTSKSVPPPTNKPIAQSDTSVPNLNPSAYWENFSNLFKKRNRGKNNVEGEDLIAQDTSAERPPLQGANEDSEKLTDNGLKASSTKPQKGRFWGNLKNLFRKEAPTPSLMDGPEAVVSSDGANISSSDTEGDDAKNKTATSEVATNNVGETTKKTPKRSFFGGLKNLFRKQEKSDSSESDSSNQETELAANEDSNSSTSDGEDSSITESEGVATNEDSSTANKVGSDEEGSSSSSSTDGSTNSEVVASSEMPQRDPSEFFTDLFSRKHQGKVSQPESHSQSESSEHQLAEGPSSERGTNSWRNTFRRLGIGGQKGSGDSSEYDQARVKAFAPKKAELGPDHMGVVSEVLGTEKGPFREPGEYKVSEKVTGLLLPVGHGQVVETKDHRIQMILKKPVLISADKNTKFKIEKILDIHELVVEKGRLRIKVLEEAGLWTVRGRDMSMNLAPNSDVVVDTIGSMITRITVIEGEIDCLPSHGFELQKVESGKSLNIGLAGADLQDTNSAKLEFLQTHLNISSMEDYQKKLASAQYFQNYPEKWPLERKIYSGALCTKCGYGFDSREQPFSHCPSCHERLVAPENVKNESPDNPPKSTKKKEEKKPSTLDFILGAFPVKLSLR